MEQHLSICYSDAGFSVENTSQTLSRYWPWPCRNSEQFDIERPRVRLPQSCWCWCVSEGRRWGLAWEIDRSLAFGFHERRWYDVCVMEMGREGSYSDVLLLRISFEGALWVREVVIESSLRRKLGLGKCFWHFAIRVCLLKLLHSVLL